MVLWFYFFPVEFVGLEHKHLSRPDFLFYNFYSNISALSSSLTKFYELLVFLSASSILLIIGWCFLFSKTLKTIFACCIIEKIITNILYCNNHNFNITSLFLRKIKNSPAWWMKALFFLVGNQSKHLGHRVISFRDSLLELELLSYCDLVKS